jgi:hypothetical protein
VETATVARMAEEVMNRRPSLESLGAYEQIEFDS